MALVDQLLSHHFLIFTLVLVRVSGLMIVAPVFGTNEVPAQVRALLACALALLVTPLQLSIAVDAPSTLLDYLIVLGGELVIGLTLGLGVMIVFSGVQLAGSIISQVSGTSLADVYNPGFDTSIPLFSHFLHLLALAIYVASGGHRMLMAGLLGTFLAIPPGGAGLDGTLAETIVALVTESFTLGIRAAAPATTALLLATLVMGLVSRTLPQLNVLVFGFGFNALVTFATLAVSVGSMGWLFLDEIEPAIEAILTALESATG